MKTKLNALFIILLISCNFILATHVASSKGKGKDKDNKKAQKLAEKSKKEAEKAKKEAEKNAKKADKNTKKAEKEGKKSGSGSSSSSSEKISPSDQNNSTTIKVLSLNPFYLFTVGFVENLGGQPGLISKCVPKEWLGDSYQKSQTSLEKNWEGLNSSLKSVLTLSSQIVTTVCATKSAFETFVIGDKKSFIQKNMSLIRSRKGVSDFYSKGKEQYEKVKKSFISLVGDKNFQIIMAVLRCGTSAGFWTGQMASSVAGIAKKIAFIEAGLAAGGVGVAAPIADIFINLICNWKAFVLATNNLVRAFETNDKHDRWDSLGRFFGSVAKIVAQA
jgi:hypothetical protein